MDAGKTEEGFIFEDFFGGDSALISVMMYWTVTRLSAIQGRPPQTPSVLLMSVPMTFSVCNLIGVLIYCLKS